MSVIKEPVFDAQKVHDCFKEILSNEVYTRNMQKQQKLSQKSGGRDLVVQVIENTAEVGSAHLIDQGTIEAYPKLSFCLECFTKLLLLAIFAALATFTVLYFVQEQENEENSQTQ